MSMFGLGKVQLIIGAVLVALLVTSGLYTKHLIGQNATLRDDVKRREMVIESLEDTVRSQKERYEASLKILQNREKKRETIILETNKKLKELEKLKNENPEVRDYLNSIVPDAIFDRL